MAAKKQTSTSLKHDASSFGVLERLPAPQQALVSTLARATGDLGGELYLVGGGVRDVLLGEHGPTDLDFATSLRPDQIRIIGETLPGVSVYDVGEIGFDRDAKHNRRMTASGFVGFAAVGGGRVSYTHLTLRTSLRVAVSVGEV